MIRMLYEDDESAIYAKLKRKEVASSHSINKRFVASLRTALMSTNSRLDVGTSGLATALKQFANPRRLITQQRRKLVSKIYVHLKVMFRENRSFIIKVGECECELLVSSIALNFGRTHQVRLIDRRLLGDSLYNISSSKFVERLYNFQSLAVCIVTFNGSTSSNPLISMERALDHVARYTIIVLHNKATELRVKVPFDRLAIIVTPVGRD